MQSRGPTDDEVSCVPTLCWRWGHRKHERGSEPDYSDADGWVSAFAADGSTRGCGAVHWWSWWERVGNGRVDCVDGCVCIDMDGDVRWWTKPHPLRILLSVNVKVDGL